MLLRLIVILMIAYVAVAALKSLIRSSSRRRPASRVDAAEEGEEMVFDPQCQSYVPKADAIEKSGHYFCSQECARLYLAR